MELRLTEYTKCENNLPKNGKHIIGQFDDKKIIVYQAYKKPIAEYAVNRQRFGGSEFSFNRMSWIKPNFLWMMYRAGWAQKENQERILAITIEHGHFINILSEAVHASYKEEVYGTHDIWKRKLGESDVRIQWDPDHDPYGNKLDRRAIQLGIKGDTLMKFATDWIVQIEDITRFVTDQWQHVWDRDLDSLQVPVETVFTITESSVIRKLGLGNNE